MSDLAIARSDKTDSLSERELVAMILAWSGTILPGASCSLEVPTHGRAHADILLFDGSTLVAVEAKLSDWKRGVAQAALNTLVANRSYLAIPQSGARKEVLEEAHRHGVGVIGVAGSGVAVLMEGTRNLPH